MDEKQKEGVVELCKDLTGCVLKLLKIRKICVSYLANNLTDEEKQHKIIQIMDIIDEK